MGIRIAWSICSRRLSGYWPDGPVSSGTAHVAELGGHCFAWVVNKYDDNGQDKLVARGLADSLQEAMQAAEKAAQEA